MVEVTDLAAATDSAVVDLVGTDSAVADLAIMDSVAMGLAVMSLVVTDSEAMDLPATDLEIMILTATEDSSLVTQGSGVIPRTVLTPTRTMGTMAVTDANDVDPQMKR